ncbi:MAG: hypothetical protein MJZ93_02280 [Paludibacteraceae bacterium]|nr:hypothetical protein [Paludibacteraceae bacterium]
MKKWVKILIICGVSIAAVAMLVGLICGISGGKEDSRQVVCGEVKIEIINADSCNLISSDDVNRYLKQRGLKLDGLTRESTNLSQIEEVINSMVMVDNTECYFDNGGVLNIHVKARIPLFKVNNKFGDNYCIDKKGRQMGYVDLNWNGEVLVTGEVPLDFAEGSLYELIMYIKSQEKLEDEFTKFDIDKGNVVRMYANSHKYMVTLGKTDRYEQKLDKLVRFWDTKCGKKNFKELNIDFYGQVVAK